MFTHILVPLDGTAESAVAVTQACAIAGLNGARVTLLRVYSGGRPTPQTLEYLHKAAQECGDASVEIDVAVLAGNPTEVILEQVHARGADLVVMRTVVVPDSAGQFWGAWRKASSSAVRHPSSFYLRRQMRPPWYAPSSCPSTARPAVRSRSARRAFSL